MTTFTVTKDQRKAVWRTLRMLLWSLVITLAVALVFFGVNPFAFWDTGFHILIVLALWIVVFHLLEAAKARSR